MDIKKELEKRNYGGSPLLQAIAPHLSDEAQDWLQLKKEEGDVVERFIIRMTEELALNSHKGDRRGWLRAGTRYMVSEVLYHAAKMTYAVQQYEQGDGTLDHVDEFAADTANCALMVSDCAHMRAFDNA